MEKIERHINSNPKIRSVPTSTSAEVARGHEIVDQELGADFSLEIDYPRNVGVKGDQGVYGETVLIRPVGEAVLRELWQSCDARPSVAGVFQAKGDRLGRVSTKLANEMSAVTKVLIDITDAQTYTPIYDQLVKEFGIDPVTRLARRPLLQPRANV